MSKIIYKFIPLKNCEDCCRLKDVINTGRFKCSSFQELNDPMEGVFSILMESDNKKYAKEIKKIMGKVYSEKMKFKISCFVGDKKEKRGFSNPAMWGHYANGFKGVAIEVEIKGNDYKKYFRAINYNNSDFILNNTKEIRETEIDDALIEKILRHKKMAWEYEDEIRLLVNKEDNKDEILTNKSDIYFANIGDITAIYFGDPYGNIGNQSDVLEEGSLRKTEKFSAYKAHKGEIIECAKQKKIKCFNVKIKNGKVEKLNKNLWNQKQ